MAAGAAPWWWPLPAWLLPGSGAAWFVVLNVVVCAIAVLSSRARESLSPRRGGGCGGVARRASSALERVRSSFSIFSFPSASFFAFHPDAAEPQTPTPRKRSSVAAPPAASEPQTPTPPRPSMAAPQTPPAQQPETEEEEEEDANYMSMEEAYALVMAARQRPAPTEEETRRSEVDAKAEELVAGFQDEQRRRRLDSIFNYTQMLKQRAAAGRRQQPAPAAAQL